MPKNSSTAVLYGAGSTLFNIFQWTVVSGGKGAREIATVQPAFLKRNGNQYVLCELILG